MNRACYSPSMRRLRLLIATAALLGTAGCHSKYVEATITNGTAAPLNVVQVDYPSASFGTQVLQPGASFHYRFKVLGDGPIKLSFLDSVHHEHQQTGPTVSEGQEGRLTITFPTQDHADFQTSLHP